MTATAQAIVAALRRSRFRVGNEADMQLSIGEALTGAGFDHDREHRLSAADRIDFMIGAVGLEAKTRCNKRAIFRQLQRYAEHDAIEALILVTGTAIGLPAAINGKPIYLVATGRAAL
ncbi:hypothetical protein [Sphingomonas sp. Ant20]|uniref:hypothetical protein n=1 Tax=Sphingomonas sp. Ant20 TaxID=104605 RepID=UPI000537BCFD|nr:hypothetical protein [Sphingomonas sp. Ant20]KHA63582.1 hypothetical protein NI18_15040 [Sphingomonas sp. Ant20]